MISSDDRGRTVLEALSPKVVGATFDALPVMITTGHVPRGRKKHSEKGWQQRP